MTSTTTLEFATTRVGSRKVRVGSSQRDGTQLQHVTVEGLDAWIAWWDAPEASA